MTTLTTTATVYCPHCDESHELTNHRTNHHQTVSGEWCGYLICPEGHELGHHCKH